MPQKKLKYFLYVRKSSESEDRQVQSIEDQIKDLKTKALMLRITIKEILQEEKSAKKPDNRLIFSDMLKRIKNGEAEGILCWSLNRLSRNPVDSGTLSWMLQQNILKCIQTMDRPYLPDDNVLLFNVETGMANQFIIDLKKVCMRGMEGKADRGWLPSRAPIGYLNEKDKIEGTNLIVEDPERFNLVRKMWDLMLTGNYVIPEIHRIVNEEWGFRTKRTKRGGDVPIPLSVLYIMFTNLFYAGRFMWNGKEYQGKHKPMITLEEFDRVQEILEKKGKPRSKTHEFSYTCLMRCKVCGSFYSAIEKTKFVKKEDKNKTYVYYGCIKNKEIKCDQEPLRLADLEDQIKLEFEKYTIHPKFLEWALDTLNKNNDREIEDRSKIYETQHKDLIKTQDELDNLTRMRYRGQVEDDFYTKESNHLKGKITRLQENLRHTESRAEQWIELTEKTFKFSLYARKWFDEGDLHIKKEIFSALGQNFNIKDKKLYINQNEWLIPIEKSYPELKTRFESLELNKNQDIQSYYIELDKLILDWCAYPDLNRN